VVVWGSFKKRTQNSSKMAHIHGNLGSCVGDIVDFDPYRGRGEANPSTRSQTKKILTSREIVYSYLARHYQAHSEKFHSSKLGKDKSDTAFSYNEEELEILLIESSTPLRMRGYKRLVSLTASNGLINQELFMDTVERYGDADVLIAYCKDKFTSK
jgi:hypothetical protein